MTTLTATPVSPSRLRDAVLAMAGRYTDARTAATRHLSRGEINEYVRANRSATRRFAALVRLTYALADRAY